ncbi:uncharacterized protein LOC122403508 [Colletes gigas]|uniref:uncharacterized protein LOC122403508 n=1 Tax=Colletes gigas TaxID=935657 RepID=UPI001C9B8266|nr:uncharacterized protein LOC122403508 [Colletes gigas]
MPVYVEPHRNLNLSKGIVTHRDLEWCTVEEIRAELADAGVIDVKRLQTTKDGVRVDSNSYILTFDSPTLPDRIMAGYLSIPVRQYFPPPLRCFRCQRFGHTSMRCPNEEICKCGSKPHGETACQSPPCCVNCHGPHFPYSRSCQWQQEETNIQKIKVTEHLTYTQAKLKYRQNSANTTSYARITAQQNTRNSTDLIIDKLIPEISRIIQLHLESKNRNSIGDANIQADKSKVELQNPIPTQVLSRVHQRLSPNKRKGNTDQDLIKSNPVIDYIETDTEFRKKGILGTSTPITSANETSCSIRARGDSDSSIEHPAKKRQSSRLRSARSQMEIRRERTATPATVSNSGHESESEGSIVTAQVPNKNKNQTERKKKAEIPKSSASNDPRKAIKYIKSTK